MNIESKPNAQANYRSMIGGDSDDISKGAVTLNLSIYGTSFDLIYNAPDEAFDGSPRQVASGIVNFASHYRCGYVLLLGKDCWISANPGISFQAQIESNEQINQQYDVVVLPLDDSIYIAELSDGFVTREKVQPTEQALDFLADHKGSKAILAGGEMSRALEHKGFPVNCEEEIYFSDSKVSPYSFISLNWFLVKNKLYHHRLLVPLTILLAIFAFIIGTVIKLQSIQPEQVIIQPQVPEVAKAVVPAKIAVIPSNLRNSAGQFLQQISPRLSGPSLDFLKTCRLKQISINHSYITYSGEKMDNTDERLLGCGYDRLRKLAPALSLELTIEGYVWNAKTKLAAENPQSTPRSDFVRTMSRLKLLGEYIHWPFEIVETTHKGKQQEVRVAFSATNLTMQGLEAITEVFMSLSAEFESAHLSFNPDNLKLVNANFEFTVFTSSEVDP